MPNEQKAREMDLITSITAVYVIAIPTLPHSAIMTLLRQLHMENARDVSYPATETCSAMQRFAYRAAQSAMRLITVPAIGPCREPSRIRYAPKKLLGGIGRSNTYNVQSKSSLVIMTPKSLQSGQLGARRPWKKMEKSSGTKAFDRGPQAVMAVGPT